MSEKKTKKKKSSFNFNSFEENLVSSENYTQLQTRHDREAMLGDSCFAMRSTSDKRSKTKSSKELEMLREDAVKNLRDRRISRIENGEGVVKKVGYAKNLKKLIDFSNEAYDRSLKNCSNVGELSSVKSRLRHTSDSSRGCSSHEWKKFPDIERKNFRDLERLYSAESIRAFSDAISVLSHKRADMNRKYLQKIAVRSPADKTDNVKMFAATKERACWKTLRMAKSKQDLPKDSCDVFYGTATNPQYPSTNKSESSNKYSCKKKSVLGVINFRRFGGKKPNAGTTQFKRFSGKKPETETLSSSDTDDELNNLKNDLKMNEFNELNDEDLKELYDTSSNHSKTSRRSSPPEVNFSDEENSTESSDSDANLEMTLKQSETNLFLKRNSRAFNKSVSKSHRPLTQSVSNIQFHESSKSSKFHQETAITTESENEDRRNSKSDLKLPQNHCCSTLVDKERTRNLRIVRNDAQREERKNQIGNEISTGEILGLKSRCKSKHESGRFPLSSLEVIREERMNMAGSLGTRANKSSRSDIRDNLIKEERIYQTGTPENKKIQRDKHPDARNDAAIKERPNRTREKCSDTDVTNLDREKPKVGLQLGGKSSTHFCHMIAKSLPDAKIIPFEKLAEILPENEFAKVREKIDKNLTDEQELLPGLFEDTQSHIDRIKQQVLKKAKECLPSATFSKINQFFVSNKSEACLETPSNDKTGLTSYSTPSLTTKNKRSSSYNDLKPVSRRRSGRSSLASYHGTDGSRSRHRKCGRRNVSNSYYDHLYSVYSDTGAGKHWQSRLRGKTKRKYASENRLGALNRIKMEELLDRSRSSRVGNVHPKCEERSKQKESNEGALKVCRLSNYDADNCHCSKFACDCIFETKTQTMCCYGNSRNRNFSKGVLGCDYAIKADKNSQGGPQDQFSKAINNGGSKICEKSHGSVLKSEFDYNLNPKRGPLKHFADHKILLEAGDCSFEKSRKYSHDSHKNIWYENHGSKLYHSGNPDFPQSCDSCCIFELPYHHCHFRNSNHDVSNRILSHGANLSNVSFLSSSETPQNRIDGVGSDFYGSRFLHEKATQNCSVPKELIISSSPLADKDSRIWRGLYESTADEHDDGNNQHYAYLAYKILNLEVSMFCSETGKVTDQKLINASRAVEDLCCRSLANCKKPTTDDNSRLLNKKIQISPSNNLFLRQTRQYSAREAGFWSLKFDIDVKRSLSNTKKHIVCNLKLGLCPKINRQAAERFWSKTENSSNFKLCRRKISIKNKSRFRLNFSSKLHLSQRNTYEKDAASDQTSFLKAVIYRKLMVHVPEVMYRDTKMIPTVFVPQNFYGLTDDQRPEYVPTLEKSASTSTDNLCNALSKSNEQPQKSELKIVESVTAKSVSNEVFIIMLNPVKMFEEHHMFVQHSHKIVSSFDVVHRDCSYSDSRSAKGCQILLEIPSISSYANICSSRKVITSKNIPKTTKAQNSVDTGSKSDCKPRLIDEMRLLQKLKPLSIHSSDQVNLELCSALLPIHIYNLKVKNDALDLNGLILLFLSNFAIAQERDPYLCSEGLSRPALNFKCIFQNGLINLLSPFSPYYQMSIHENITNMTAFQLCTSEISQLLTVLPLNFRTSKLLSFFNSNVFQPFPVNFSTYVFIETFLTYWHFKYLSQACLTDKLAPERPSAKSCGIQTDLTLIDTELFDTFLLTYILSSNDDSEDRDLKISTDACDN